MINVYELHYGDTVKFTNGETATINTVKPSQFHDGCLDIEFDKEVTGYISGRRGGEKRRVWCYEQNGNFANYRGSKTVLLNWFPASKTIIWLDRMIKPMKLQPPNI